VQAVALWYHLVGANLVKLSVALQTNRSPKGTVLSSRLNAIVSIVAFRGLFDSRNFHEIRSSRAREHAVVRKAFAIPALRPRTVVGRGLSHFQSPKIGRFAGKSIRNIGQHHAAIDRR
jgi:hypothetical protein